MENSNALKKYRILVFAAGILAIVGMIVFTVYERVYYDPEVTLLKTGAPVWHVVVLCVAAAALAVYAAFIADSRVFPLKYGRRSSLLTNYSSLLTAISLFMIPVLHFLLRSVGSDHLVALWNNTDDNIHTASALTKITAFAALIAALYFLAVFFIDKTKPVLGIVSGIWILLVLLRLYYDMTEFVQDFLHKLNIVSLGCAAVFLVAEIFYSVGKPFSRTFAAFGVLACFFCFVSGFPKVILTVFGFYTFGVGTAYALFEVAIALYAFSRLAALAVPSVFNETGDAPSSVAAASVGNADGRSGESGSADRSCDDPAPNVEADSSDGSEDVAAGGDAACGDAAGDADGVDGSDCADGSDGSDCADGSDGDGGEP